MDYLLHILILITIYSILSVSLNLILGSLGIVSVAHGALFGIGAYAYAILTTQYQLSPFFSILICSVITAIVGYLIAFPSLKLKGDYLALATFGFAIVSYDIFNNLISITKGPMGITAIPNPVVSLFGISNKMSYLIFSTFFATLAFFLIRRLDKSPWGRVIHAIRERENIVLLCGKNPVKYKLITFAFASFWAGIAGALYAGYISYIHPSNFITMVSILILCMVIIGGMGSLTGSIIGALIFVSVPEILRFLDVSPSITGIINQFLFGLILILFMVVRPQGILGKYRIINE